MVVEIQEGVIRAGMQILTVGSHSCSPPLRIDSIEGVLSSSLPANTIAIVARYLAPDRLRELASIDVAGEPVEISDAAPPLPASKESIHQALERAIAIDYPESGMEELEPLLRDGHSAALLETILSQLASRPDGRRVWNLTSFIYFLGGYAGPEHIRQLIEIAWADPRSDLWVEYLTVISVLCRANDLGSEDKARLGNFCRRYMTDGHPQERFRAEGLLRMIGQR